MTRRTAMTRSTVPATALLTLALMTPTTAWAQNHSTGDHTMQNHTTKDIVGVAVDAGSFQTLLAAAKAAGLVATLQSKGPFTVFAPTDAAFAKLPEGTVEALLQDPARLAEILKYHVVPGRIGAADVLRAGSATPTTAQGQVLDVRVVDGKVMVNGATVVQADVDASNGVIHVIDAVMLPREATAAVRR
ncbi:MAG: fasciclin domain-containing protein [Gemmatimonadota bacterium]